jgi:hypothetical protein
MAIELCSGGRFSVISYIGVCPFITSLIHAVAHYFKQWQFNVGTRPVGDFWDGRTWLPASLPVAVISASPDFLQLRETSLKEFLLSVLLTGTRVKWYCALPTEGPPVRNKKTLASYRTPVQKSPSRQKGHGPRATGHILVTNCFVSCELFLRRNIYCGSCFTSLAYVPCFAS